MSTTPAGRVLSDSDLIRRVQRGERELFGELHARHHGRVFRYVAQSIFQRETAQDIAGEVWLRAYGSVDRFDPRSENSVVAWLLRIATNLVTDYRRRLGPACQSWSDDDGEVELRLRSPGADTLVLRAEKARTVRQALNQLSDADRQIIYLAHQDDLSCAEIAVAMNKPSVSAVTSHLHRAMRNLRTQLVKTGWFAEATENGDLTMTEATAGQRR